MIARDPHRERADVHGAIDEGGGYWADRALMPSDAMAEDDDDALVIPCDPALLAHRYASATAYPRPLGAVPLGATPRIVVPFTRLDRAGQQFARAAGRIIDRLEGSPAGDAVVLTAVTVVGLAYVAGADIADRVRRGARRLRRMHMRGLRPR